MWKEGTVTKFKPAAEEVEVVAAVVTLAAAATIMMKIMNKLAV
jgi:hypothetical protein